MADGLFDNPAIQARIVAAVSRVQSKWLTWNADPIEGDFDTKIVETLMETLDAHAAVYLSALHRKDLLGEYRDILHQTGAALLRNADQQSLLSDPDSDQRIRRLVESSADYRCQIAKLSPIEQEQALRVAVERIRGERSEKTDKWHEWKNQMLARIEMCFEARYRHWMAEAIEQVEHTATEGFAGAEPAGAGTGQLALSAGTQVWGHRTTLKVTNWEAIEISFLSDERVQIRSGEDTETCNYTELGFADRRNGKPNRAWVVLRSLAELNGTIKDTVNVRGTWPAVEKRIQEIRNTLRRYFGIGGDPTPFLQGVGYRSMFRIRCSPSFKT